LAAPLSQPDHARGGGHGWLAALAALTLGYCSGAALQAQTYLITR
jgi:hypothetical protein